ncbi:hypothetical protein GCM10027289_25070 [Tsukamurella serpentis]
MHPPTRSRVQPPRVRWLARRPPETLPVPRPPSPGPLPTPRYRNIPRWGLRQDFTPVRPRPESAAESAAVVTPFALRLTIVGVFLAAGAEFAAYLLLVVNRSGPVPAWLAWPATVAVFALGWLAVILVTGLFVVLTLWLQAVRERTYAVLGTTEPRPRWQVWLYCLVPVVNLVTAPVLLVELVNAQDRAAPQRADGRVLFIRRWWAAWVLLTIVTLGCVAYSRAAGGLQHGADSMVYTTLTYLLAGAFLVVTARGVRLIERGPRAAEREEQVRWLAV